MASITRLVMGDKGISLLVIVGLFIVFSLTLAPLSVYKPSDALLKDYLNSVPWNIAVVPPDFSGVNPRGSTMFVLTPPPLSQNPLYDISSNAEMMLNHIDNIEGRNVSLYCSGFIVPVVIPLDNVTNYTLNLIVYQSPLLKDVLLYSPDKNLAYRVESILGSSGVNISQLALGDNASRCLDDLYREYTFKLYYNEIIRMISLSNLPVPVSNTETLPAETVYPTGYEDENGIYGMVGDAALYVPVSRIDSVVKQLESSGNASFYLPWKGGVPRYVILVKYDFSKTRFNPVSPRSIEETLRETASSLHGYISYSILSLVNHYSDVLEAFRISTVVVFLMFVMGLFVVVPATAGAMTGGLRRILYLLRLRGVRYKVLRRSLFKATMLAMAIGLVIGLTGVFLIITSWMPEFKDIAFHDIFEDYFTMGAIIVSSVIAGILYWRRFVKQIGIEKLEDEWRGEERGRSRLAMFLLALSLYHIIRGYIGWSAIATLSSASSNTSMLVIIVLIILSIIEFLTTVFTPVMLAYSVSVIIMNNIDYLVRIVSSSKRVLGDIAVVASGVGKLVTPSLIGLSTILVFSLAVLYPSLSTGFMAENAVENAAQVDIGAPYVFTGYYDGEVTNHTLRDLAANITSQCEGECSVLFHIKGGDSTGTFISISTTEDTYLFVGNDLVILVNPEAYYRSTYSPGETRVVGGSYVDAVESLEKPGNAAVVSQWDSYYWNKAEESYHEKGYMAKGNVCVDIKIPRPLGIPITVKGSCKTYTAHYMIQVIPGKGLIDARGSFLLTGPWMIDLADEGLLKLAQALNSTTTPIQVEVIVLSKKPLNLTSAGVMGNYISLSNITDSNSFILWRKSVKLGLGAPSLEFTGAMLVSLLIILTALLSYVSVKDIDKIYRLLRLRGINRRMTFATLFTPWATVTLVVGFIGIVSGIGIDLIYKMSLFDPNSGFASLAGFQYSGESYTILLGDGYVDKSAVLAALPYTLILIAGVLAIPFIYFYRVTRGTPAQSMREV